MHDAPFKNELFNETFVYTHQLAVIKQADSIQVLCTESVDIFILKCIAFYMERSVDVCKVSKEILMNYLRVHYPVDTLTQQLHHTLKNIPKNKEINISIEENDEPVTKFVNELISDAQHKKISDIHLEAQSDSYHIRFRRHGLLYSITSIPLHLAQRVITKLKIMGNLDIAERRMPQDGRIKGEINIRINTCPTLHGEKIVLRLLYNKAIEPDLNLLGFSSEQIEVLLKNLAKPQGIIFVTGPTGSGKTITLYSALNHLNTNDKNIITIEDPIEIKLAGINQINCNDEIGLSFEAIMHAILRQDPDIIMIGEIRNKQTATVALQAAQTGHLVLTTLHTNDAASTMTRLKAMQIETSFLDDTISLVIAQRLLRTLCDACKIKNPQHHNMWCAHGCDLCFNGYTGRVGIFELMQPDSHSYAKLLDQAMLLAGVGKTSLQEIKRVLGDCQH